MEFEDKMRIESAEPMQADINAEMYTVEHQHDIAAPTAAHEDDDRHFEQHSPVVVRPHSHRHKYQSVCLYTGSSKHKYACISMADQEAEEPTPPSPSSPHGSI